MVAILTGDIIQSAKVRPAKWLATLKKVLEKYGPTPQTWEIYRGDSFQLQLNKPQHAFLVAVHLKAALRSIGMDVRISIGVGTKKYKGKKITESNGTAFVHSGRKFDTLKEEKITLAILTGNNTFDKEMNLFFRLALTIIDNWSAAAAAIVAAFIEHPGKSQNEIAGMLRINQSAVSQQKKRAHFDLINDLNTYFAEKVNTVVK